MSAAAPAGTPLHFEDFTPGQIFALGERAVTRDEIVAFARRWDPQPMHLDEAAAADTLLGELTASGWHTSCLLMRAVYDHLLSRAASMGAPGIDEVRWMRPVRPGDRLRMSGEVLAARPSGSRPGMGLVTFRFSVETDGGIAMTQVIPVMFERRRAGP